MEYTSSLLILVLLVLIARESREGTQAIKSDPSVQLKSSERFRTLRMQMLEPPVAIVVVGSLLLTDLERSPLHAFVAVVGGIAGYAFGAYRARSTYVAAVPQHKGVILRYSVESFVALGLLVVIKLVAERDLLPEGDIFRAIIATLLAFLLVESIARVIILVRHYRRQAQKGYFGESQSHRMVSAGFECRWMAVAPLLALPRHPHLAPNWLGAIRKPAGPAGGRRWQPR